MPNREADGADDNGRKRQKVLKKPASAGSPVLKKPASAKAPVLKKPASAEAPVLKKPASAEAPVPEKSASAEAPVPEKPASAEAPVLEKPASAEEPAAAAEGVLPASAEAPAAAAEVVLPSSEGAPAAASEGVLSCDGLTEDLRTLIDAKGCGPILIRLSWHDAGVYSTGAHSGGCPNAALRFADAGEGSFGANAGLPDVAVGLLAPIAEKYVPRLLSHADLWALAANVAIACMGGPEIPTRFGRVDAKSAAESVPSQEGRLPDGDKGADHLRDIFHPKGLDDKAIVALSGAHTVGRCHAERSGFEGPWTAEPLKFDNSYFVELLAKTYEPETSSKGKPQHRCPASKTMMLSSDLALLADPLLKASVERYAANQEEWFADFRDAWIKLQEAGCDSLQDKETWLAAREAV